MLTFEFGDFIFNFDLLRNVDLKGKIQHIWGRSYLNSVDLTTTGEIVGTFVSDLFCNTETVFEGWE